MSWLRVDPPDDTDDEYDPLLDEDDEPLECDICGREPCVCYGDTDDD